MISGFQSLSKAYQIMFDLQNLDHVPRYFIKNCPVSFYLHVRHFQCATELGRAKSNVETDDENLLLGLNVCPNSNLN